jgi:hypothetical protein
MRLQPRQHADDWPARVRAVVHPGKVAGPASERLAATDRHAEEDAAGDGQAGKVSNGTRRRLPPGISELRLRNSRT